MIAPRSWVSGAEGSAVASCCALFSALLNELRTRKFHSVIGGVALPNPASIALLEKFSLRQVAHFRQVGNKFGQWIDVGYWQLVF
jgi:L-amino acid N-acyltransferase YncA